jgi:hypothetical protein
MNHPMPREDIMALNLVCNEYKLRNMADFHVFNEKDLKRMSID